MNGSLFLDEHILQWVSAIRVGSLRRKHVYTTVATLLMSCLFPAVTLGMQVTKLFYRAEAKGWVLLPKGPSHTKSTPDSKFTMGNIFAMATVLKHYGGHLETTIFKGKLSSKSQQKWENMIYGSSNQHQRQGNNNNDDDNNNSNNNSKRDLM